MYYPFDRNITPYCRHKSEPLLESGDMILNWDRSIITDKTVDFDRPDTVLIDRQNKAALVVVTAVPLTFPKLRQRKTSKYEKLALEIKKSGLLTTYLYTP